MRQDASILRRLDELIKMEVKKGNSPSHADSPDFEKWATSVLNILQRVFGEESAHYQNFLKAYSNFSGYWYQYERAYAILLAAKEDYEGGYLFNLENQLSGELLGDFVGLAKSALSEHHKDVAGVLACAALEDALKRYASVSGLEISEKSMQEVVNALKSKGLVSGSQKSLLDTMPKIRDFAMHANWDKLSEPDVNSIIGFVEQFLLTHFS